MFTYNKLSVLVAVLLYIQQCMFTTTFPKSVRWMKVNVYSDSYYNEASAVPTWTWNSVGVLKVFVYICRTTLKRNYHPGECETKTRYCSLEKRNCLIVKLIQFWCRSCTQKRKHYSISRSLNKLLLNPKWHKTPACVHSKYSLDER